MFASQAAAPTVLIVEDSWLLASDMSERLAREGYVAEAAPSAAAAARRLKRGAPDLILLDIDLGDGQDGVALARTLPPEIRRRILFVSAHAAERSAEANALGCCGVIDKPLRDADLVTAVADALWRLA